MESALIFHHKYPIPVYSMINGNHVGHSSREAPKSENNAVNLTALLFIVHDDVADQMLPLVQPRTLPHDCIWMKIYTVRIS